MKNYFSSGRKIVLFTILIFLILSCKRTGVVSMRSLLLEMSNRESVTRMPNPEYSLKQFSSYDRRSLHPDSAGWFANADYTNFLGVDSVNGRREFILFDASGPGAVVRWWMTFAGAGSRESIIRVYLDNEQEPVLERNAIELLDEGFLCAAPLASSVSPLTEPERRAYNLYLPIPYRNNCRITLECDSIVITAERRTPSIYYNIGYRTYKAGTETESFSIDELRHNELLIKEVNELLVSSNSAAGETFSESQKLKSGDSASIRILKGNRALDHLSLRLTSPDREQALRSCVVSVSFDGNNTVWVPAGDFFGTGYKLLANKSWYNQSDTSGLLNSQWIMPFRKEIIISVINYGEEDVAADLQVTLSPYKWTKESLYFGAGWHEYKNIRAAGSELTGGSGHHTDLNINELTGSGIWVGDAITFFNSVDAWWGEGDEKIYVDDETFPSSFGTGTEDYYGYAWCRPEVFYHPFITQPDGSGNFHPGLTVNSRYRNLDAIPFEKSIRVDIELWHWVPAIVNSAHTSFYYIKPGSSVKTYRDPLSVQQKVVLKKEQLKELL